VTARMLAAALTTAANQLDAQLTLPIGPA